MAALVSVNVAEPGREVVIGKRRVATGIFKRPVEGPVAVERLGLAGDFQADPRVHGGPDKAVYLYPREHYAFWRDAHGLAAAPWGFFGENLTIEGLLEDEVGPGDRLRAGTVTLEVTTPRGPCAKLGGRVGDPGFVKTFLEACRPGFYARVVEQGVVRAGDALERLSGPPVRVSISELARRKAGR
ncbi:MAG TPA: MOSC domain-containing protein [Thermoanaerobaculia bacterium]